MIEGVVSAVLPLLEQIGRQTDDAESGYRAGVYDTVVAMLLLPGVREKAMHDKVKYAFREVVRGWTRTKTAEAWIVEALLA